MRWMNLEPIIQSEVSQKEKKTKYCRVMHIYMEFVHRWTYLQGNSGVADIEKGLVDTVGEGESGASWESSMETYTLPYLK